MLLVFTMLIAWTGTGNNIYKEPFEKSIEAEYASSELKHNVDGTVNKLKDKYPVASRVIPLGYALGIKKSYQFTTTKVTPFKDTIATYKYENRSGSVYITWRF